jgi:hippurate hydrolase
MNLTPEPDQQLIQWIRSIRRHLHLYPELGNQEVQTAEFIETKLTELEIPFKSGVAGTGIIAKVGKKMQGAPGIALRADMDALPITEATGLPFSSRNPGIMHACGHDGHVAMLLGAAALLRQHEVPGQIVLLFQPAEETEGGALRMIDQGALDGVDAIFAGHIDLRYPVREIAVEPGLISAYTDEFLIRITGPGGHAAKPHETVDSIVVAGQLVMALQTLVSREVDPSFPAVVTVGKINGGTASNVIASEVVLEGTIRTTRPEVREKIISGLERMVLAMGDLYHAQASVAFTQGYPPVINHPVAADIARQAATLVVGDSGVRGVPQPSLGGEDFAYFLQKVPGCLVRFGAGIKNHRSGPAHSPNFDFDEGVLPVGAAFLAQAALEAIRRIDELRGNK